MKTKSEIFTAAHKLAKNYEGNYNACFSLALTSIYFSLKSNILKETDKAVLVRAVVSQIVREMDEDFEITKSEKFSETELWIPRSQITKSGHSVSSWFLEKSNYKSIKF